MKEHICPKCGAEKNDLETIKEWDLKSSLSWSASVTMRLYRCKICSKSFRRAIPKEE